ncbi:unnamed protein product [Natator depressus]
MHTPSSPNSSAVMGTQPTASSTDMLIKGVVCQCAEQPYSCPLPLMTVTHSRKSDRSSYRLSDLFPSWLVKENGEHLGQSSREALT